MLLADGLLVSMPSIAFGPRGSSLKRDFLGRSALLFLHSDFQGLLPVPSERNRTTNNEGPQSHFEGAPMALGSSLPACAFAFSEMQG